MPSPISSADRVCIVAVDTNPDGREGSTERSLTAFTARHALKAACEHLEMELSHYGIAAECKSACGDWIEELAG